jgi:uncharacterized membrane protein YsdA (DUF1294 family)
MGFAITGYDKYLSKIRRRRIPEKTLLSLTALGGTIGTGIAMLFFRHKTAKTSFLWKFFGILLLQIVIIYLLYSKRLINL